jgi:hypothetical protein
VIDLVQRHVTSGECFALNASQYIESLSGKWQG